MRDEQTIKAALLGTTRKLTASGNHEPDLRALRRIIRAPDEVVPFFCTGCGTELCVNALGAAALSEAAGGVWNQYAGKYFRVSRCIACSDGFEGVGLEVIE